MRKILLGGGYIYWFRMFISRASNAIWTSFASMTLDFSARSTLVTSLTTCCVALLVVNFETSDQLLCFGAERKDKTDSKTARVVASTSVRTSTFFLELVYASNSFDRLRIDD
ncbi:hypothetical protein MKW94_018526 [Papaver nudicaule]|uniref:Uncharacterized protein n=1 Tax=Papaver nudicaule TaxID=74823 RepID=A0AA41UTP9_PAPNU|nr:hypothetical protein [Papaver nudicaule]